MKQIAVLLVLVAALAGVSHPVFASGLTTTETQNGVVVTTNADGTTYLTTQVTGPAATESSFTYPTTTTSALENTMIQLPRGFATSFSGLLNGVLSFVLVIAALLVFAFIIWGGFEWITSGGDKGKTDKARQKLTAAIIGLVIVAASYAILNLVIRFLGFSNLNDVFQSTGTIQGAPPASTNTLEQLNQATPSATPL